jgi:hypothetical protein
MSKVVFTFGRMNPPTIGHQKLVDKVEAIAKKEKAPARIYLSHTQNNKKDPLNYAEKISFARKAFGKTAFQSKSKTIFQIMAELDKEFDEVIMVVGSDRVTEFNGLLQKYNGKNYDFDSIKVVSAGARDPDATGVEGMSASKLRAIAVEGDFDTFKSGLAKKLSDRDAKDIYDTIRSVLTEDMDEDRKPLSISQRKAIGRRMKRLAPKMQRLKKIKAKKMANTDVIKKRANKAAIAVIRKKVAGDRGKNYASLAPTDKIQVDKLVQKKSSLIPKIAKKLLPKIRKAEIERLKKARGGVKEELDYDALFEAVAQDKDIKDREGTQPKKYHSGLSKSTKAKRDAEFKKGAEKDSDDPTAYPDKHAGDTGAKTKLSKHTKKYRDMFGEGEVDSAKEKIDREKASDKKKHDRMLDRARTSDTKAKNQEESFEITEDSATALKKKSEKSGISLGILKKVYNRGMAAWKTGHRPGANQQQWAYARVNSFITGGKTRTTGDADLWKQHKGNVSESVEMLDEVPTGQLIAKLKSKTISKNKYQAALSVLKQVVDRKKKEAGKDPMKHGVVYYAGVVARQYNGVNPRVLANMYTDLKEAAGEFGTDALTKKYKKDTPCQEDCAGMYEDLVVEAAEYKGRKVELNNPFRLPSGSKKKFGVYVKNDKGNVIKVTFGDPNMEIKRDDPKRRAAFRSRHDCENKKDKTTAGYWSCYQWRAGEKVDN